MDTTIFLPFTFLLTLNLENDVGDVFPSVSENISRAQSLEMKRQVLGLEKRNLEV